MSPYRHPRVGGNLFAYFIRCLFSEWIPAYAGMTALLLFFSFPAHAEEIARATLISKHNSFIAGKPFQLGLLLDTKEGWHTYWENPGDAGMATEMSWTLPPGFTASAIDWPAPKRIIEGTLATFSYEGKTLLPVTITPPAKLKNETTYPFKLHATWLACKDICIPESADLELTLPVMADEGLGEHALLFAEHDKQRPVTIDAQGSYQVDGNHLVLSVPADAIPPKGISAVDFFPRQQNIMHYAVAPAFSLDNNKLTVTLETGDSKPEGPLSGILTLHGTEDKSYDVTFALNHAPLAAGAMPHQCLEKHGFAPHDQESPIAFPIALLFALLGGLVLNLMPCVLPVLSLKALAIAKKSGHTHVHVVQQGVAYTLGILISFLLIASVLILLRASGEAVGWGYQMQSPAFVGFLIYLLFMVGLSLSGYFHLPVFLGGTGSNLANESSARGSFFTGILATAVATPCTAPFMASAVGVALTLPIWQALLIFEALGFGLALPFLLISIFPALRRFLPKPGAWMESFQQLLAFPMYGSVIWLLWVLTLQTGAGGVVVALTALLAIVIIIWMKSLFAEGSAIYRVIAFIMYAGILAGSLQMLSHMEPATAAMPGGHEAQGISIVDYSLQKLAELRRAGKPVLVDATAAWCITCQINARTAIHTDKVMDVFRAQGITLMIADWTRRNDDITNFLGEFGFKGVPLVVFYPADNGKPKVLPQILTEDIVIRTINTKE